MLKPYVVLETNNNGDKKSQGSIPFLPISCWTKSNSTESDSNSSQPEQLTYILNVDYTWSGLTQAKAYVNNHLTTIIFDSGSSVSIISSKLLTTPCIPFPHRVEIVSITNNTMNLLGWTTVAIQFPNSKQFFTFTLYVLDNFKFDLLLDNDFHTFNKCQFDFQTNQKIGGITIPTQPMHIQNKQNEFSANIIESNNTILQLLPKSINLCIKESISIPYHSVKRVEVKLYSPIQHLNLLEMS